jgi:GT2 family glycosyltransferase
MERPSATIAIVTRDRREELRAAVRSALDQDGHCEVVVVDDGSQDGSSEMLRREFPEVRVVRFEESAGLVTRRNNAAEAARADVIVSIDDDAVFSSNDIVKQTLNDFDHPRIGAVAIPYIDIGISPDEHQRAPDQEGRWMTSIFRGTAYAIRREVLRDLGGFNDVIFHQGEDWDLSLRILDAGYLIRLGRAAPIHHRASALRDRRKMDLYGRRNEVLISWTYFPAPWNVVYMLGYAARGIAVGLRIGRVAVMIEGVLAGVRDALAAPRRPIGRAAFHFDQRARSRLRAGSGVPFAEAEAMLGRLTPQSEMATHRSPPLPRGLDAGAREMRAKLVRLVGRPVRCEVCGEVLFRGLPFIWRGKLKLLGAESALVRADWDKMNRIALRHVESQDCRPAAAGRSLGGPACE